MEMNNNNNEVVLLTEGDVARRLAVSLSTIRSWRIKKIGPAFVRLTTGSVRYRPEDVERFIKDSEVE
jgi:DNA-binding transcriptional MerR regulator